jgi:GTPase SAR1 family protein
MFDITAPQTFSNVLSWIEELWKHNGKGFIPIIILGNKVDLRGTHPPSQTVESSHGEVLAQTLTERVGEKGFEVPYLETSAKTRENVDEAFSILGHTILTFVRARLGAAEIQ